MIGFAPSCFPLFKATIELAILLLLVRPVRLCLRGKCVRAQGKRGGAKGAGVLIFFRGNRLSLQRAGMQ